jgi:hypothetical protein
MLSVILWGVMAGGGIYAAMVYFPAYLSHLPESAVVVTGPYGLNEGIFWLSIHPLLILSLIISLISNWRFPPRRKLITLTFAVYVVVLIITQLYFLPELFAFARSSQSSLTSDEWQMRTNRWQLLNIVRGVVIFANFFPLLFALTRTRNNVGE